MKWDGHFFHCGSHFLPIPAKEIGWLISGNKGKVAVQFLFKTGMEALERYMFLCETHPVYLIFPHSSTMGINIFHHVSTVLLSTVVFNNALQMQILITFMTLGRGVQCSTGTSPHISLFSYKTPTLLLECIFHREEVAYSWDVNSFFIDFHDFESWNPLSLLCSTRCNLHRSLSQM